MSRAFTKLLREVRACTICQEHLPLPPRPVLQIHHQARILIAGQAPGIRAHNSSIPWNDPSGVRLRNWLGVSDAQFYDERLFALLPAAFCYPGTGTSGDLPPRPECRATWHERIMAEMGAIELVVVAGMFSRNWLLPEDRKLPLTDTVRRWRDFQDRSPTIVPTPHPSPRNLRWLKKHPWFEKDVLPALRRQVARIVEGT